LKEYNNGGKEIDKNGKKGKSQFKNFFVMLPTATPRPSIWSGREWLCGLGHQKAIMRLGV
jgi:hypothetical protein